MRRGFPNFPRSDPQQIGPKGAKPGSSAEEKDAKAREKKRRKQLLLLLLLLPTCQVRVVRFYVSPISSSAASASAASSSSASSAGPQSTATIHAQRSLPDFHRELQTQVFPIVFPQSRPSAPSVRAQCSLPDLNREVHDASVPDLDKNHPRPVFPAGLQPRPSTPSVPCHTSTTAHNRNHKHQTHNHKHITNTQPQTQSQTHY